MQTFHSENVKLYTNKCHFSCTKIPFYGEEISTERVQPDQEKLYQLTDIPPIIKNNCNIFLGIMSYIGKFSPSTAKVLSVEVEIVQMWVDLE